MLETPLVLAEAKTYLPGPGRCIYCWPKRHTTDRLDREHVIPKTLGGKLVLHTASCRECSGIINKEIENPTLQRMWIAPRTHLGMPTSNPKQTLPLGTWTAETSDLPKSMDEVDFNFEQLAVEKHPFTIIFPRFAPPGILWGEQPKTTFTMTGLSAYQDPSAPQPQIQHKQSAEFQPFSPDIVCRSIAKIAHGAAVAELGMEAFSPMLPGIILGHDQNICHLVGSTLMRGRKKQSLHEITLYVARGLVLAKVQLFARYGMQPFLVVVGRASIELLRWRISALLARVP